LLTVYTIGHSTRSLEELAELLVQNKIELLADVRTIPRSRMNPQFNKEAMPESLAAFGIAYVHISALGGLRGHMKSDIPSPNSGWENASFRNFADYTLTVEFEAGYKELILLAKARRTAIMCSEAVWWRCHRRIITDYLLARGIAVLHIMSKSTIEEATMTKFAEVTDTRKVIYPAEQYDLGMPLF
jgi:uncharacterized protein (DUF488 family)